jgi:hypothetical protein
MNKTALRLCLALFLLLMAAGAEAAAPESFIPAPGLRLSFTGVLGSDGTRLAATVVTAKLSDAELVVEAETEMTYFEYRPKMDPKWQPMDAAKARTVWRYVQGDIGISKLRLAGSLQESNRLILPSNIQQGTQWKTPWGSRMELTETDWTVETPAGVFAGCIVVEEDVYAAAVGIFRHYYAPGVGLIKTDAPRKSGIANVWYELQRLERIPAEEARAVVMRMIQ